MNRCHRPLSMVFSVCFVALVVAVGVADGQLLVSVFDKTAPESVYDLRVLEKSARDLSRKLTSCTVGVEVANAHGSGVIVSQDGYVLTAGHVIGRPGRDVKIRLPDGKTVTGKTLGVHTLADGGLVKITEEGDWPHVEIVSSAYRPKVGDWCMAMGHPNGFDAERSPPLRLGRVVSVDENRIQTDCPLMGGDSGGPVFDMQGRVIGINSWITENVTENFHGSALAHTAVWDQMAAGEIYPATPPSRFLQALDVDGDGQFGRAELPDGYLREVFDRLAAQFNLAAEESHSIKDFARDELSWRNSPRITVGQRGERTALEDALPPDLYVRGQSIRDLLLPVVSESSKSIVRIDSDGKSACLGMIVDTEGRILTKASSLGTQLTCGFSDGRKLAAELVAVDEENDLALLKVDATDLSPVSWSKNEIPIGSWLISPNVMGGIASLGVISVSARPIEKTPAMLGVEIDGGEDSTTVGRVEPQSGAEEAGIQPGDTITKIMGQQVQSLEELRAALREYRAGDVVSATVQRREEILTLEVTLGAPEDIFFRFRTSRMNGPMSRRRDGFQSAFQHDSVLQPTACGGPVVDISGKVVGMNIARANRIATYALPRELLQSFVNQHRPSAPTATPEKTPVADRTTSQ